MYCFLQEHVIIWVSAELEVNAYRMTQLDNWLLFFLHQPHFEPRKGWMTLNAGSTRWVTSRRVEMPAWLEMLSTFSSPVKLIERLLEWLMLAVSYWTTNQSTPLTLHVMKIQPMSSLCVHVNALAIVFQKTVTCLKLPSNFHGQVQIILVSPYLTTWISCCLLYTRMDFKFLPT